MAQRLLLVNPTKRRKTKRRTTRKAVRRNPAAKRGKAKVRRNPVAKRRSPAQRRATARLVAANRRRAAGKRRAPARRTSTTRRRVRRNPATKATQRRTYSRTARMNPVKRRRRRSIRRNPVSTKMILNDLLKPAAVGAVGAIANDALYTYLPLPAQFKTPGVARYASKGITAIAMTWLASKVTKRQTAVQLGVGALTCLTAEIARNVMAQNFPTLAPTVVEGMGVYNTSMAGMGYYNPAMPAGGGLNGMGVYVPGSESYRLPSLATKETAGVAPSNGLGMYDQHGYDYS